MLVGQWLSALVVTRRANLDGSIYRHTLCFLTADAPSRQSSIALLLIQDTIIYEVLFIALMLILDMIIYWILCGYSHFISIG